MYRDNTPTFNTGNRKLVNFKGFKPEEEHKELRDIQKSQIKKNGPDTQSQEHRRKNRWNKVTHKIEDLHPAEVDDKLLELEEIQEAKMKHLKSFQIFEKNNNMNLTMVFGDENTIFKKFDDAEYPENQEFLIKNNGKVNLCETGFAEEWVDFVDFDQSYAYIDNGKLYVVVYGLPNYFDKSVIEDYYHTTLEQYIIQEYGEFFETNNGCPICMIVERNGQEVIV